MDANINIAHYTDEQLVDSLISVNDEIYLDNALLIYQTLLDEKGWQHNETDATRLGHENHWMLEFLHTFGLSGIILNGLIDEIYMENHRLNEKIQRLNAHLNAEAPQA